MKLKKTCIILLAGLLALGAAPSALAAHHGTRQSCYTDTNKDGYCDYHRKNCHYTDEDQDGVCDTCGKKGTKYKTTKQHHKSHSRHCSR